MLNSNTDGNNSIERPMKNCILDHWALSIKIGVVKILITYLFKLFFLLRFRFILRKEFDKIKS